MFTNPSGLSQAVGHLKAILKQAGKSVRLVSSSDASAVLKVSDPDMTLDIVWIRQVGGAALKATRRPLADSSDRGLVIAVERLSRAVLDECRRTRQCVLDRDGNGLIMLPGILYERFIAEREKRRIAVSGTPFTAGASRVVRALLAQPYRHWNQSDIVAATEITQGYASRCLAMLVRDGYCAVSGGKYRVAAPDRLLDEWAGHYRFDRHRQYRFAFANASYEEGLRRLASILSDAGIPYVYTGWSGAHLRAPYAVPPVIMAYIAHAPKDPESMGLYPVDTKENAVLLVPHDKGVFQCTQTESNLAVAADPQIYIDLRKLSGRGQEQAAALREKRMNWKDGADA